MILFLWQTSFVEVPLMLQMQIDWHILLKLWGWDYCHLSTPRSPRRAFHTNPHLRMQPSTISVRSSKVYIKVSVQIVANNINYEKTHVTYQVITFCQQCYCQIYWPHYLPYNWIVVYDCLLGKISHLAAHPESAPDTVDLQLMAYSLLDRNFLVSILTHKSLSWNHELSG